MRFPILKHLFLLLCLTATVSAEQIEKRALFIVETSKDSKPLSDAGRKLVTALVQTGLGGLLETNDTFGIWTFNETLHTGKFPMQRWTPQSKQSSSLLAHRFLEEQPYEKSAKIETIQRPLNAVIQNSPALMVVLIVSGKQPVSGTPFDSEINHQLKNSFRDYQKKASPAVIILSATSGQILRYSVSPAIGDVRIPLLTVPTNNLTASKLPATPAKQKITPPTQPKKLAEPVINPKTNTALVITKEGVQNVSTIEANQIANDRIAPKTVMENKPIITPVILKHEVEVITQVAAITPNPPTELTALIQPVEIQSAPEPAKAPPKIKPIPLEEVAKPLNPPESILPAVAIAQIAPNSEPVKDVGSSSPPDATPVPEEKVSTESQIKPLQVASVIETENKPKETATTILPHKNEPQPLVAQTHPVSARSFPFLIFAVVLMIVAISLAFLIGRHTAQKPHQSLVSDWAERDRIKK